MRISTTLTFIAVLFMISSGACVQSRHAADQFEVTEFKAIKSSVVGNIHIRQSPTVSVTAEGSEEILNNLDIRMDDDKLVLSLKKRRQRKNSADSDKLLISISTPTLTAIDLDGVGNIEIEGNFSTPQLTIDSDGVGNFRADNLDAGSIHISSKGVGNITIGGKSGGVEINSRGVGNVDTSELKAESAIVSSRGIGDVSCYASQYLKASSSGIGNVTYYGNPTEKELSKNKLLGKIIAGN